MHGKIINYNSKKGYGFIYSEVHKENIFVHHSAISNAKETKKGLSAISVVVNVGVIYGY